jgi:hypothetical protein
MGVIPKRKKSSPSYTPNAIVGKDLTGSNSSISPIFSPLSISMTFSQLVLVVTSTYLMVFEVHCRREK